MFTTDNGTTVNSREQYFGLQVNSRTLLQYSFSVFGGGPAFQAYFDNRTSASVSSMSGDVANYKLQVLANETEYEGYSGEVHPSRSGLLIFVFSGPNGPFEQPISLIVRNATSLENGIRVNIGSPVVHKTNISSPDGSGVSFVSLEEWPLTLFSNSTGNVELSASGTPGAWVKFVPSHVSGVGPGGTNVTMLLSGAVKPFGLVGNNSNAAMSLFIDALGSNGQTGENIIPVIYDGIVMTALDFPGPINFGEIGTSGGVNSPSFDVVGAVYDPPDSSTLNQSLSVALSVVGMLQNSTTSPLPSWVKVIIPQPLFMLNASQPFYFQLGVAVPAVPEGGPSMHYIFVLSERVGGENFLVNLSVNVSPPIRLGT